jgi:chemotaxis protein MotB
MPRATVRGPNPRLMEGGKNRTLTMLNRLLKLVLLLTFPFAALACGYSQEEWDQKVRENESLRNQLAAQRQAHKKCEADYADALHEIEDLKTKLKERGINIDNLSAKLDEERKALEEYRRRAEQLDQIRKRFELLRSKLQKLTQLGLNVVVRDNRMVIQLPGDVLFDSGRDKLKKEGQDILRQVADVIRNDSDLSKREFQVAGHTDSKPLKGGQFIDNWGLSAMRARSVLIFLTDPSGGQLDANNWSAAGYADTDPVSSNDSDDGRAKNRRVELVVLPNVEEMLNLNSLAK